MTDADWASLVRRFVERDIDSRTFHDLFFKAWHRLSAADWRVAPPSAIESLFFVVEAYCPDPALRDPESLYEADDAELRLAAETALRALDDSSKS